MSYNAKKKSKGEEGQDDWMTTYADAITLILCFLVLLVAIAEPNQAQFEAVRAGFLEAVEVEVEQPFTDLYIDVQGMISENMLEDMMSVEETEKGLVIELASSSFYESGSAEFKAEAVGILLDLSALLYDFNYEDYVIEVEGHTDNVPMKGSAAFPTNWELSAGRSSRIVRFFIEENLDKERMKVEAFADTRPKVPNMDEYENPIPENQELNRRIAIKVERNN